MLLLNRLKGRYNALQLVETVAIPVKSRSIRLSYGFAEEGVKEVTCVVADGGADDLLAVGFISLHILFIIGDRLVSGVGTAATGAHGLIGLIECHDPGRALARILGPKVGVRRSGAPELRHIVQVQTSLIMSRARCWRGIPIAEPAQIRGVNTLGQRGEDDAFGLDVVGGRLF